MTVPAALTPLASRTRILVALGSLSLAAWVVMVWQWRTAGSGAMGLTMGMDLALFLAVWTAMMVATMFPASAPMVLMFARIQAGKRAAGRPVVSVWLFTGAYLALWVAAGAVAYAAALALQSLGDRNSTLAAAGPRAAGVLIALAGLYQITPLKRTCLRKCRSPFSFIVTSWRDGVGGAIRMGLHHGLYCLGCCWLLFAVLFPVGMSNIAALALVSLLIFAEKTLPHGHRIAWFAAALLLAYGSAIVVSPGLLPGNPAPAMPM